MPRPERPYTTEALKGAGELALLWGAAAILLSKALANHTLRQLRKKGLRGNQGGSE